MKVILTQQVTDLGGAGDVVEVKDGYARNFLMPRGLAMRWTRGAERQSVQLRRAQNARVTRDRADAEELAQTLAGMSIIVTAKVGEAGKLFGSVTSTDIVEAVVRAGGPTLDRRSVELPAPIKTAGAHKVRVHLHPQVNAVISLEVTAN
jgi:large subunit ribosomal protein L9